ncbi:MAG: NAD(P)-binding domain-containing protein [Candidatus Heimdallarchaeota archaeon]|nr:NAD(P)-binding domain-containing protein [Candidatus Heimdallarchaeota archaeon]MDH5644755.1 NAD(P)-binding domain-containing protein [Candidatus Heimdallarchaeota archaeon]
MIKKIGIVGGSGKQGTGITKRLANKGYEIIIGSRDPIKGNKIAEQLRNELNDGNIKGGSNIDALIADIIILAIPSNQVKDIVLPHKELIKNKIILDVTVNLIFGKIIKIELVENLCSYEMIRNLFPESMIVGCLKTISASTLNSDQNLHQVDFQMTTSDEAYDLTSKLVSEMGLQPVRVRGKYHAETIERMVAMAIQLNKTYPGSHTGYQLIDFVS